MSGVRSSEFEVRSSSLRGAFQIPELNETCAPRQSVMHEEDAEGFREYKMLNYAAVEFASKTNTHSKNKNHRVFSRNDDAVRFRNNYQFEMLKHYAVVITNRYRLEGQIEARSQASPVIARRI